MPKEKEDLLEEITQHISKECEDLSPEEFKEMLDEIIEWCEMIKDAG